MAAPAMAYRMRDKDLKHVHKRDTKKYKSIQLQMWRSSLTSARDAIEVLSKPIPLPESDNAAAEMEYLKRLNQRALTAKTLIANLKSIRATLASLIDEEQGKTTEIDNIKSEANDLMELLKEIK